VDTPRLSIIVPALNEADGIASTLHALAPFRARGAEVVVADGGSTDGTVYAARPLADRVVVSEQGRARQQNAGATVARGGVLLFLHADTRLPEDADVLVLDGLTRSGRGWGRFDVRLTGRHPALRVVERMISLRSRVSGIATGDQAMFVRRDVWERVGGFPDIPLMEDVALSRMLKRTGRPLCISRPVTTSSRRWETRGITRTILLMWRLRLQYWLGAEPSKLAERYR
jgi:rSAM/selenodomain-associated transferase 2